MSINAVIAYTYANGQIKSINVDGDGDIESLGMNLVEYFANSTNAKSLIKGSIIRLDEDVPEFYDDETLSYDNLEDFKEDMDSVSYYYLYQEGTWMVSKPNNYNFKELEDVIEEEF